MPKKVSFGSQPVDKAVKQEQWVASRVIPNDSTVEPEKVKTKRFTIDVPEVTHRSFKEACVRQGVTMADKMNSLLTEWLKTNP